MGKKITLFVVILIFIVSVIAFFALRAYRHTNSKIEKEKLIAHLPNMKVFFSDTVTCNSSDLPVIVYHFSPDCEHCQYMAKEIKYNINKFSKTCILMITSAKKDDATNFMKEYDLDSIKHIHLGFDKNLSFYKIFGSFDIPSFYIYNKEHELSSHIKGETKIENLIKYTKTLEKN
jgi:thiol-disulfide isomerase/thioredoxin